MDTALIKTILQILGSARDLAIATNREDGFPQTTTVSYVNDGLTLYFGCGENSQKARNIARDNRVSVSITGPYDDWSEIKGVSLAGTAVRVTDSKEIANLTALMIAKFPQIVQYMAPDMTGAMLYKIVPKVISVLDYSKGFGHTDLLTVG